MSRRMLKFIPAEEQNPIRVFSLGWMSSLIEWCQSPYRFLYLCFLSWFLSWSKSSIHSLILPSFLHIVLHLGHIPKCHSTYSNLVARIIGSISLINVSINLMRFKNFKKTAFLLSSGMSLFNWHRSNQSIKGYLGMLVLTNKPKSCTNLVVM